MCQKDFFLKELTNLLSNIGERELISLQFFSIKILNRKQEKLLEGTFLTKK